MAQTINNKHATRKEEKIWIAQIVAAIPADRLNSTGDPFQTVADTIRHIKRENRYKTVTAAAEHYLQGLGLHGFPFTEEDHAKVLTGWGFKATQRALDSFFSISAGLLVEVLQDKGLTI